MRIYFITTALLLLLCIEITNSQATTLQQKYQRLFQVVDRSDGFEFESTSDSSSSSSSASASLSSDSDSSSTSSSSSSSEDSSLYSSLASDSSSSNSASKFDSTSSSSSEDQSTVLDDFKASKKDIEALRQTNWSKEKFSYTSCKLGMFRRGGKCRPCSQCGPDLFESQQCSQFTDTICDWCLNPNTLPEHRLLNNINYHKKCADIIQLQREFHELLEQRNPSENSQIVVIKPIFNDYDRQKSRYIDFPKWSNDNSIKLQMIIEMFLYLTPFTVIFALIYFISKRKTQYRTVTVEPPKLDENQCKHIIRAADNIRDKLGKKGYNRLEEFI